MKILITGSSGMIGQHLAIEMRNVGHMVAGMDIKEGPGQDASDPRQVRTMIDSTRADLVVHLAGRSGVGEDDVLQTIKDNAGMTAVVAQAAGELGVRLAIASSAGVYGNNGTKVCDEISGPWSLPQNVNALSRLWSEKACELYAPDGFTALRFSMIYGPGLAIGRGRSALVNMMWQAKHGLPMPVHIGAERSWCWVGDAVRGARLAIEKGEGPYNIGRDDDGVSMERIAQLSCVIVGGDPELVEMVPLPARQAAVKRPSSARLRRLGWTPTMSLYDGMAETYETWVRHLDKSGAYVDQDVEEPVTA